jgi:hypothetical protein
MNPLMIAMIGGTALSAFGNFMEGKAQAQSLMDQARMEEMSMKEKERRFSYNLDLIKAALPAQMGTIRTRAAAGGIELTGAPLDIMETTARNTAKNMIEQMREQEYEKKIAKARIRSLREQASTTETAGLLGSVGSVLGGAGKILSVP